MASPPLLDFAALTAPIPGDQEAGAPVPYATRQKLDAARKEEEANPDDPTGEAVERRVDWPSIVRQTQEMLAGNSKDLLLAARLTEALARLHGFAGVRDGLHLLGDLIEQCWDRLHPIPDEGEGMEVRAGPFHWLSDSDRGARFPNTLRNLPLVRIDTLPYSWQDWKRSAEGKPLMDGRDPLPKEDFTRAVPFHENTAEDLAQALEELTRLETVLDAKFGEASPGLMGLRQALEVCRAQLTGVVRGQPASSPAATGIDSTDGAAPTGGAGVVARPAGTREEAYRQISQIANLLEQLEPHSPIPDLLRRVVELGRMPFRQLIRELVRDPNQLSEIRREFGLKEADIAPQGGDAS